MTPHAMLWRDILHTDRAIFGAEARRLEDRPHGFDRLAQPGYIGANYQPGGLVILSMNPGNGGSGDEKDDRLQYAELERLRDSDDADVAGAFSKLMEVLTCIMPDWKIYRGLITPTLKAAGLDFAEVAYLNLLKYRTRRRVRISRELYRVSWKRHTSHQIELLAPGLVVALGKGLGESLRALWSGEVITLERSYSNLAPAGRAELERLAERRRAGILTRNCGPEARV